MTEPSTGHDAESGFSLVETVVAFAILSLVMTTAIQIIGAGTVRARKGQDRGIALAHAQSSLARLTMGGVGPSLKLTGT